MEVFADKAEDPNGEGEFTVVTISLADEEVLSSLLSIRSNGDNIVSIDMPLGYAAQLGGKLLELAKENEDA